MASHCEKCGLKLRSKKDRFCPTHAMQVLRRLETVGYLQPLREMTASGDQVISTKRFLTLKEQAPAEEAS